MILLMYAVKTARAIQTIVGVAAGRVAELVAAQRELAALDGEAGVPWRRVSRTAVFGGPARGRRSALTEPLRYAADWRRMNRPRSGTANEYRPCRFLKTRPWEASAASI